MMQKLVGRYPRLFRFIGQRIVRDRFSGRPLTFLILAGLSVLLLLLGSWKF